MERFNEKVALLSNEFGIMNTDIPKKERFFTAYLINEFASFTDLKGIDLRKRVLLKTLKANESDRNVTPISTERFQTTLTGKDLKDMGYKEVVERVYERMAKEL